MDILCPVCRQKLQQQDKIYRCVQGHSFDIAREGYVNLNLRNSQKSGDNPDMIRARKNFLEAGYYDFLREKVNGMLNENAEVVDLACGEGYYTAYFQAKEKIGIDLSKSGLKIASKSDKSTTYLLSSIFRNPLPDDCADFIITIFAPVACKEASRLLKTQGRFILVRPARDHLLELKQQIYENAYYNEDPPTEYEGLVFLERQIITKKSVVARKDLINLFMMTPYCNTTSAADKAKIYELEDLPVTFSFAIDSFRKA